MRKTILLFLCLLLVMIAATGFIGCKGDKVNPDNSATQEEDKDKDEPDKSNDKYGGKEDENKDSDFIPVSDGGNYIPSKDYE